ncbi:MAG: ParB/RepB/Spo0J family partition protein [Janthinobacterium lividum]
MSKPSKKKASKAVALASHTVNIPLDQLTAWEGNVRKTDPDAGIDALAASISVHGLLQSLVVKQEAENAFSVIAGRRRFMALTVLAETGIIAKDFPVSCVVVSDETNFTEISLVENAMREQMHPADEFEAFRDLMQGGMASADVAARFGVTETMVRKRMVLAEVSPTILAAYRAGELSLAQVQAFAVTDDKGRQHEVFKDIENAGDWAKTPSRIRDRLTDKDITAADRRVALVSLDAYLAAGGTVRRDLFSEGADSIFIDDIALLEKLVAEKLESTVEVVRAEGWKWVEVHPVFGYSERDAMKLDRVWPTHLKPSPEAQKEIDRLVAEQEQIEADAEQAGLDEYTGEQSQRLTDIEERIEVLQDVPQGWSADVLARGGAVVSISGGSRVDIERGLIKPEDKPTAKAKTKIDPETGKETVDKEGDNLSAALVHELTSHKSAAISAALATRPYVALVATVHAMTLKVFFAIGQSHGNSVMQIDPTKTSLAQTVTKEGACQGLVATEELRSRWVSMILPDHPKDLWKWCMEQPAERLLELLAVVAAVTVNTVATNGASTDKGGDLVEALDLNMADWFTPTVDNYFGRVSKPHLFSIIEEVSGAPATPTVEKMKKGELAAYVETVTANAPTKWVPPMLRRST